MRGLVTNPVATTLMDFRADITAAFRSGSNEATPEWVRGLTDVVVKAKWQTTEWNDIADTWQFPDDIGQSMQTVIKMLSRVWPHKSPEWVLFCKAQAQVQKDEKLKKDDEALKAKKVRAASEAESEGSAAAAPAGSHSATKMIVEIADTQEESAAAAPGKSVAAAPETSVVRDFMVGDIIVLDSSVAKKYVKQEAQVVRLTAKTVLVNFMTLKDKQRSFPKTACKVIQPSTMRLLSAKTGSKATTGSSAASAPASPPTPEKEVNEEEYARELFGSQEDEP